MTKELLKTEKVLKPLWREWFDGRCSLRVLPAECVADCSSSGDVSEAVEHWVGELGLEAPPWLLREHLRGFGAWDTRELCDHQKNLKRLLWTWSCSCAERSDYEGDVDGWDVYLER